MTHVGTCRADATRWRWKFALRPPNAESYQKSIRVDPLWLDAEGVEVVRMASSKLGPPAWSSPPRPAHRLRGRVIVVLVAVGLLAGGSEVVGIPKILRWRFASQAHARALEEAVTGKAPTRQTTVDGLFIQLSGGFLPGDQEPVTIDRGKLTTPARIDTVMGQAATILTAHGYTRDDTSAMSDPGLWNCRFDGTPNAQGLITAATSMTCYVSRRHGREHAEIAVVTSAPPQYSISYGSSSGPNADLAGIARQRRPSHRQRLKRRPHPNRTS